MKYYSELKIYKNDRRINSIGENIMDATRGIYIQNLVKLYEQHKDAGFVS